MPDIKKEKHNRIGLIVGTLLIGVFGGILGAVFAQAYIFTSNSLPFFKDLNLLNNRNFDRIIIQSPAKVVVEEDVKIKEVADSINIKLVKIYTKKVADDAALNQIYGPLDFKANGVILTADGWIISAYLDGNKDGFVVAVGDNIYNVADIKKDPITEVSFLKVNASNLSVIDLGNYEDLNLGQKVVIAQSADRLLSSIVNEKNRFIVSKKEDLVRTTEKFSEFLALDKKIDQSFLGSPIVDLRGVMMGIITREGDLAIPIYQFRSSINQLLKSKEIKRPKLGLSYIDLSRSVGLFENISGGRKSGALIYGKIDAKSSLMRFGVKAGDIISKVNGEDVNANSSLTRLVQDYEAGEEVEITILQKTAGKNDWQMKTFMVELMGL